MTQLGVIQGHPVLYCEDTDTIYCKDVTCSGSKLIEAYDSGLDRYTIGEGLVSRKHYGTYTLGCLEFTHADGRKLILQIKRLKPNKNGTQNKINPAGGGPGPHQRL